jgi:hypothetical protein
MNDVDAVELTKQTILSQAKGLITPELSKLWLLMIDKLALKFIVKEYDWNLINDSKHDCYILLVKNIGNYKYKKSPNAFPYWSEIIKRSFTLTRNRWTKHSKKYGLDIIRY